MSILPKQVAEQLAVEVNVKNDTVHRTSSFICFGYNNY